MHIIVRWLREGNNRSAAVFIANRYCFNISSTRVGRYNLNLVCSLVQNNASFEHSSCRTVEKVGRLNSIYANFYVLYSRNI